MPTSEKYVPIQQLLDRMDDEYASAVESVVKSQRERADGPSRLQSLADERTAAFVELSEHYLPDLDHRTLMSAWREVRGQIREVFLLKDDRCRKLRSLLMKIESKRANLESQQYGLREQFEKARRDHCSKQGNVHKVLREDSAVASCLAEINRVDVQIELALNQLDTAKSEANKKLPSYEASTLFQYLQDRHYGTPQYRETGLERRWDRWLAKLVDYRKSKKSYDFLCDTPEQLKDLIDQKRERYKLLLKKMEKARSFALQKFGLTKQKNLRNKLGIQLRQTDQQITALLQEEASIGSELCEIESIQGEYYSEAIAIYRKFLTTLDPEILRVYAECTESPIDDQICARLRKIHLDIEAESNRSSARGTDLEHLKKYRATLWELCQRLRLHMQASSIADEFIEAVLIDRYLAQLRKQTLTMNEAWQAIHTSLIYRAELVLEKPAFKQIDPRADLVEATFLAAASELDKPLLVSHFDPSDILLAAETESESSQDYVGFNGGFRIFAFCESPADAKSLTAFLEQYDIACFTHDPVHDGPFTMKQRGRVNEVVVMVQDWRFDDAKRLLSDLQHAETAARICPNCESTVQGGYKLCWNCLARLES